MKVKEKGKQKESKNKDQNPKRRETWQKKSIKVDSNEDTDDVIDILDDEM